MPKVFLSNNLNFDLVGDQTILEAARVNNIAIQHSCKNGRCGVCIAPIISGETKAIKPEISLEQEHSNNILTCCRTVLSDTYLDINDLGKVGQIPLLTLPCRIEEINHLNSSVIELVLRFPPNSNFIFLPGQYIDLIYSDFRRSYSIANAPREDGKIELQIKKVDNGYMSDYIFNKAKKNDLLRLEGPQGTFAYREDDSDNIVFIATGTGIAPIKAILESFLNLEINKKVFVIWGARYLKDLYFDKISINTSYKFIHTLSREKKDGACMGYVQDILLDLNLNLSKTSVYACGSETMIKDALKLLVKNGLSKDKFYSDAFVSTC